MAKDNVFLGFGRGPIGDVVMYRAYGTQISRARNRNPRNPNTLAQMIVRAATASVSRLYSVGQEVFNHAFEGYLTAADNQRRFNSLNINILRNLIVSDQTNGRTDAACLARVGARGLSVPVPFVGMQISDGSLSMNAFTWDSTDGYSMPEPLRDGNDQIIETVAQYCARLGLVADDIYTFVAYGGDPLPGAELAYFGPQDGTPYDQYAAIFSCIFGYGQMKVKASALSDTTPISNSTTLAAIFEASERGVDLTTRNLTSSFLPVSIDRRMAGGVIGVIRSREDSLQRSTSFMMAVQNVMDWGISTNWISAAWTKGDSIMSSSDLLLEGRDFTPEKYVEPFAWHTVTGANVTLVGIVYRPGSSTFGDPAETVQLPAIPMVMDDGGNLYYIKNNDTEQKYYGSWLAANAPGKDGPWYPNIDGATNANSVGVESLDDTDDLWFWLFDNGITPMVIIGG